jgi:glycosyltransferase involved in cell wall biosynthesis
MSLVNEGGIKHLYVVSELFYPETISTGYIMTEISKSLAENYDLKVIAGPELYESKNISEIKPLPGIEILRSNFHSYNKNKTLSRIFGSFTTSIKMLRLMLNTIPEGSRILMVTNPVSLFLLVSWFVKRKSWNVKLIVHDVFPDNLIVIGLIKSKQSPLYQVFDKLFRKAYLKMNTIIVLGRDMKELFISKNIPESKIEIIENWADIDSIKKHTIKNKGHNFLFAGNLGRVQGLELLMEAIKKINDRSFQFTFIGNGAMDAEITKFIKSNHLNNVIKYGWLPREEQDRFLSYATVGVISLKKGMFGLGVPSKCYNLLAAGKPIFYIGEKDSEIHRLIIENNIGWFAEAGNLESIVDTMLAIIDSNQETLRTKGKNARVLAEEQYNKELILEKYRRLI